MSETRSTEASRTRRTPRSRRALLAGLTVSAAIAGTLTLSAAPSGAAPRTDSLVGTWDLTVSVTKPDGSAAVTTPRFVFAPDHRLSAEGPKDSNGVPAYVAHGFWNEDDHGDIAMYISHSGRPDGAYLGAVQAEHLGRLSHHDTRFSTHAYAFTTQQDGTTQGPISVSSTAVKVSDATQ
ncbi:hypothetical protein [Streptomyces roseochromogenus]|uniref:Lipocalin-like domain-containing protein n=1 Tax=Streptomyces roseochromogenus subsp. oscitans DS 12.976 TaxID=1352936 RepID=V6K5L7_STRRC|nr:hypothetical protein [Streptomyces roseochromogenus]EST27485.1 hypothetical protein M878_24880 [Streptomyces roseochromogenus subsp. oscitans DS 12.976]